MAGRKRRQDERFGVSSAEIRRYESIINDLTPLVQPDAPAPVDEERTWHVAVTNPNCEGRVVAAMHERGIPTVAPVIRFYRKYKRSVSQHTGERALMPRYVIFGLAKAVFLKGHCKRAFKHLHGSCLLRGWGR